MEDQNKKKIKRNMDREGKPRKVSERTKNMSGPWLEAIHFIF